MAIYPGAIFNDPAPQFFDNNGDPLAGGFLYFYVAGTSTPQDTFNDSDLQPGHENSNPITLDSAGRSTTAIFLQPTGYKVVLKTAALVTVWTRDEIESVGQVFAANFGTLQTAGSKNVTSGYTILPTDRLVTVNSTGGPNPCVINLPNASTITSVVIIKNLGTIPLGVTPNGIQTIDTVNAVYSIAAAASPAFPSKIFLSDGVSNFYVANVA